MVSGTVVSVSTGLRLSCWGQCDWGVGVWRSDVSRLSCGGCGVGGCGEVRVYVNNMTVGGVERNERTLW